MKLKAILFDFDGTLVHSIDLLVGIFGELLAEQNLTKVPAAEIRKLIGEPLPKIFKKIAPTGDTDFLEKRFREIEATRNNSDEIKIVAETLSTLKFLKSHNLRLGIVSTKRVAVVEKLARELGIWEFFEIIVGRDLITKPKPDPEPILFGCRELGIKPQEILFVGDSLLDLESAKAAKATFVGVLTGVCDRAEFAENRADYVFGHIGELINLIRDLSD